MTTDATSAEAAATHDRLPRTSAAPRQLVTESVLVLGVSLGASAIWAVLALIRKLTDPVALGSRRRR